MITGALFFPKTWHGFRGADWRTMYVSRVFRILPMQAATVAIIALVASTRVETTTVAMWLSVPARIALWLTSYWQPRFFMYDDSAQISAFVMWSLLAEWKFYLLALPIISIVMSLIGLKLGRWLIPVVLIVMGTAFHYSGSAVLINLNYAMFGCGMVALLVRSGPAASLFGHDAITPVGIAAVVAAAALSSVPDDLLPLIGYTLFFTCVVCGNRFGGLLTTRGALVLGEASFSIYLLHGVLLNAVFVSGSRWIGSIEPPLRPWLLVVLLPAMAAIAIASYLLIERPMIARGRSMARRWRSPATTAVDNSSVVAAP